MDVESVKQNSSGPSRNLDRSNTLNVILNEHDDIGSCDTVPNVTLSNENASVMDRLGKTDVEDLGLETTSQKVLDLQAEHVIELHLGLIQYTDAN